jgi:hypothetical protein
MNSIFKKFMKFWCVAACAVAFCLPLYSVESIQQYAAPYMINSGTEFSLPIWVSTHSNPTPIIGGIDTTYFSSNTMHVYFLGTKNQQAPDESATTFSPSHLFFSSPSTNQMTPAIFTGVPGLYTHATMSPVPRSDVSGHPDNQIYFSDFLSYTNGGPLNVADVTWNEPTGNDLINNDWHFYDLTGDGLPGYFLGALATDGFYLGAGGTNVGNGHVVNGFADWSQLAEAGYADEVFLFGPEPMGVPEPGVYLVLGTLLGVVALVARRKTQIA